jgi:hypothetical protein
MKSCFENIKVGDEIAIAMDGNNFWIPDPIPPTHTDIWYVIGYSYDHSPWLPYVSKGVVGGYWYLVTPQWHESIVRIKKYTQK